MVLKEKGVATSTEIYKFFEGHGWDVNKKTKNTLRSLFSMMKTNGKIEGNALDGFSLTKNGKEKESDIFNN